jgi:DNA-directed RNA polymerase specialized sigma24 family protein
MQENDPKVTTIVAEALKSTDPAAQVAQLHLFGGLSVEEAGAALGLSRAMAYWNWKYARAWLRDALRK